MSRSTTSHALASSAKTFLNPRHIQPVHQHPFTTSARTQASPRSSNNVRSGSDLSKPITREQAFDIADIPRFMFDDTTTRGHMIMERKRESLELLRAVERDRDLLQRQRKPFTPPHPSLPLRFTRTLYLTDLPPHSSPSSSAIRTSPTADSTGLPPSQVIKRVLRVPVQALVEQGLLHGEVAVRKFQIMAGSRWSPPGKESELERGSSLARLDPSAQEGSSGSQTVALSDAPTSSTEYNPSSSPSSRRPKPTSDRWESKSNHGWIKMSEDAFPQGKMNRKWLSDALDRLIAEANNPENPIPASIPIDKRAAMSRLRKQGRLLPGGGRKPKGLEAFPKEWL